jgi:tetratricopeptide (TPR) repeat protein
MVTDKFELAVSAFKHCLKLNSRYEPALFNLAKVYQKQEKWDTSTQQFKSFLEVTGPKPSAYAQIGFNFNRQADWENAQDFLEKSLSLQPNNFNARISLAETLANLGQMKKARELLQTALKMDLSPAQNEAINKMMVNLTGPQNATP